MRGAMNVTNKWERQRPVTSATGKLETDVYCSSILLSPYRARTIKWYARGKRFITDVSILAAALRMAKMLRGTLNSFHLWDSELLYGGLMKENIQKVAKVKRCIYVTTMLEDWRKFCDITNRQNQNKWQFSVKLNTLRVVSTSREGAC